MLLTDVVLLGHPLEEMVLNCSLIKTTKRITSEIHYQAERVTHKYETGGINWKASNGYEIISEHRMDIQSRRIWLNGAVSDEPAHRSGSMVLPTQKMCDDTFPEFIDALKEWATVHGFYVRLQIIK